MAAADDGGGESEGEVVVVAREGPGNLLMAVLAAVFPEGVRPGLGVSHERQGVLGVRAKRPTR